MSTHALQLHTLRMQTLVMVKKYKPLNNIKMSVLGVIVFRREQGAWNDRGLQTKGSHGAILQSRSTTILRSEGSPHDRGMRKKFTYRLSLCSLIPFKTMVHFTWSKPRRPKNLIRFKPLISALPSVAMVAEVSRPTSVLC